MNLLPFYARADRSARSRPQDVSSGNPCLMPTIDLTVRRLCRRHTADYPFSDKPRDARGAKGCNAACPKDTDIVRGSMQHAPRTGSAPAQTKNGCERVRSVPCPCWRVRSEVSLKFFTTGWGDMPDAEADQVSAAYETHLAALGPSLPEDPRRLWTEISLHDALVRGVERESSNLQVGLRAGDQASGYIEARLSYGNVVLSEPDEQFLKSAIDLTRLP